MIDPEEPVSTIQSSEVRKMLTEAEWDEAHDVPKFVPKVNAADIRRMQATNDGLYRHTNDGLYHHTRLL